MNLIHANNTTIASPRRQRRHHAHHGPAHHTEWGRSHAPIVVNLDEAIIVTCGDAQQPPCSHHRAIVGFVYRGRSRAPHCVFGAKCREAMNGEKLLRSVTATTRRPPRGPQCPRICHRLRSDRTRTNFSLRSLGQSQPSTSTCYRRSSRRSYQQTRPPPVEERGPCLGVVIQRTTR